VQTHQVESLLMLLCNWGLGEEDVHAWAFADLQERFDSQVQTCRATREDSKYCLCSVAMGMRIRFMRDFFARYKSTVLAYLGIWSVSLILIVLGVTCVPDPKLLAATLGGQFAVVAYWCSEEERSAMELLFEIPEHIGSAIRLAAA